MTLHKVDEPIRVTPLELATGVANGLYDGAPSLPKALPGTTARMALESVVREALLRPPCVVTFSGGRDSSSVLALAAHVAKRDGLQAPIPVTLRFPAVETSHEDEWQGALIDRYDLGEAWIRLEIDDEADCVGPWAREAQGRLGLLWPLNTHFLLPMMQRARGGSLLTGVGGDEILTPAAVTATAALIARRRRPRRGDGRRLVRALAPRPIKRALVRRGELPTMPWLTPRAQAEYQRLWIKRQAAAPIGWGSQLRTYTWPSRHIQIARSSIAALAALEGVHVLHPFEEPMVIAALAAEGGFVGFRSRTGALRHLFEDVIGPEHIGRKTKASFDFAFWNRHARAMAVAWDGTGLDPEYIDGDRLREEWRRNPPDGRSYLLLQHLWLQAGMPV